MQDTILNTVPEEKIRLYVSSAFSFAYVKEKRGNKTAVCIANNETDVFWGNQGNFDLESTFRLPLPFSLSLVCMYRATHWRSEWVLKHNRVLKWWRQKN